MTKATNHFTNQTDKKLLYSCPAPHLWTSTISTKFNHPSRSLQWPAEKPTSL